MSTIHQKAESFTLSYKSAMELSLNPPTTTSLSTCAQALASHYAPRFYNFTFGRVGVMPDDFPGMTSAEIVASHLQNFKKSGLGYRIRLDSYKIYAYSETSAQCWLTWEIEPENDVQGWKWTNIYSYRIMPDGKEGWESSVADGEIEELLKRVPNFFGE